MDISRSIAGQLQNASWIRRMFEEGARMKRERGAENVYDFTLGNPDQEPPESVMRALRRVVDSGRPHMHGYMPNPGFPEVRAAIAAQLSRNTGLAFEAEDVFMTVGSSGACNVILKSILDPGDEVIVLMPAFSEYPFYVANHAGRMVPVETDARFLPDVARIRAAITPRTRALILNTPNNPTGRVYPGSLLRDLGAMLDSLDHPVLAISDEPYKSIVYDGRKQDEVAQAIGHVAVCNSWSKSQGISGQRIGYLALSPRLQNRPALRGACAFANRILGFINAPAIWQWVELESLDEVLDCGIYQRRRDLLCDNLARLGYEVTRPEGTFYVFARTPIEDDIAFIRMLAAHGVLGVPGTGFGRAGYMRLSLTVPTEMIERSFGGFAAAMNEVVTCRDRN
ncbi:MAG: pyridoxal phosphate-dependent aminotransferase [Bryobacteraceae bacterium]